MSKQVELFEKWPTFQFESKVCGLVECSKVFVSLG